MLHILVHIVVHNIHILVDGLLANKDVFLNTIGDCILKEGSPGMIVVLRTLFVHTGVTPPVNDIEQICRCLGEKLNAPSLCHKLPRLLNYAIYDKMTCMLHHHLLAVTIA